MRRSWLFVIPAALLAAVPAHAGEWQKTYTVTGVPALSLDADDSAVEIQGWDRNEISVKVHADRSVGVDTDDDLRVVESQNGNAVSIRLERRHHLFQVRLGWHDIGWHDNRVEIRVPKHSRLDVRTGDGSCDATGIEGDIALETGDGAIHAEDLSGHLRFDTADGRIRGSGLGGDLLAQTSDGRIEVYGWFTRLDLHTSDGAIIAGAGPESVVEEGWALRTSDGRIRLRISERLAAHVDAATDDGSIRLNGEAPFEGRIDTHHVRLDLNGGGPTIRLRSGDGSIHIERY